jgi:hypothetical protein
MICATCQSREERGFFYTRPGDAYAPTFGACSLTCIEYLALSKGKPPMDLAPVEAESIMAASEAVGTHLEKLGKTDFATFTEEEWLDFLAATYSAITGEVRARLASGDVPF